MKQLFINVVGHNSAGKTFISEKLEHDFGFSRINGDDLRTFIYKNVFFFRSEKLGKKSSANDRLNMFLIDYRKSLTRIILEGGDSVIMDGTGGTSQIRKMYSDYVAQAFPDVIRIIIFASIDEESLLDRLNKRDEINNEPIWVDHYHNFKKSTFEIPKPSEAEHLLIYDQKNYKEIHQKISDILKN